MKTIKLHPDKYVTLANGTELKEVPEYVTKDQLRRRDGSSSWYLQKRCGPEMKAKRLTGTKDKDESHRLINRDYHLKLIGEEQLKQKRSSSPFLSDIAPLYAAADYTWIKALAQTRANNLRSLSKVTRHLASGPAPRFKRIEGDAVKVEIVDPGFWTKIRTDELTEKSAKNFQSKYTNGLNPNSTKYQTKADGANGYLKQARGVFGKEAMKVYRDHFKLPDISAWKQVDRLEVYKPDWEAPSADAMVKFWRDLPELESSDPDAYALFLTTYGGGLTVGETMNCKYSWFGSEEVTDHDLSVATNWYIHVQPTDDWRPKNPKRIRKASVTESIFQKLIDLRYVRRPAWNERKINITDDELIKAVWTKAVTKVAADLNVTDVTVKKTCKRRGIPTPGVGFWAKVEAGIVENPHGIMPPDEAEQYKPLEQPVYTHDDYLIQRGRCVGETGVGQRLARWFKERGWDRKRVSHEMRKLHLSKYLLSTGDLVATSKQAGHATTEMTEKTYIAVLKKHKATIDLPTG